MADLATQSRPRTTLGAALRSIRRERDWSLADMSNATGLSLSTISKIENGQRSLTYDKLVQLADSLNEDISRLFMSTTAAPPPHFAGRRSVQREADGFEVMASVYTYNYLAHDLRLKRFTPVLMDLHARSIEEFDDLVRHEGDEFAYVLEGEVVVHTEVYAPLHLRVGESVFFDSNVGHAYINAGEGPARILCIGSEADPKGGGDAAHFTHERRDL